jgi:hypothetical protein
MFTNIDRKSGHSDYPVEVRDQGFDGRERGFKPAIPAREQYENWAPPRMHELVGGKSFAVAVNDRFSLGRDIAHDYAHDHPGTTAKEEGLSDFSEAVLKFGDVCDGGLYLDKTDAGGWVYHREAAQFERGLTALRVMDCALNERRCGRWAGCSRHAENSGQHAFWGKPFFNQAAHLGFQKATRHIRIRDGGHHPLELSQATCDFAANSVAACFTLASDGMDELKHGIVPWRALSCCA